MYIHLETASISVLQLLTELVSGRGQLVSGLGQLTSALMYKPGKYCILFLSQICEWTWTAYSCAVCVGTYLPTYLLTYLLTFLLTYLPTYLPMYIPSYLPTYLLIYLPTYR